MNEVNLSRVRIWLELRHGLRWQLVGDSKQIQVKLHGVWVPLAAKHTQLELFKAQSIAPDPFVALESEGAIEFSAEFKRWVKALNTLEGVILREVK